MQRNLFGQPPRARAKSDTHLTQPHVPTTENRQHSDFERISSSSEALESYDRASARRASDFEELQQLLPPHLCREEKDSSPLYKEYKQYRQYKEARRRSSGSSPIDPELTTELESTVQSPSANDLPKAAPRQRRGQLGRATRRRSSGDADIEDSGMAESAEPLGDDIATNPPDQTAVYALSHSNLARFSQPTAHVKVLGAIAIIAGAVLTIFASSLHFAAPLLR